MKAASNAKSRPPVITTLHGWAMHSGLFDDLAAHWPQADWRGIDLPGHGTRRGQAWPDRGTSQTRELIDSLVGDLPDQSWLLGWSLGGLLAMQAALARPDKFTGLVLVSATPCFTRREHWPEGVEPALLKAMALELIERPELVFNRFLALEIQGSADAKGELKRLKALATRHGLPDSSALLAGLHYLADTDISARLHEIGLPTLIIGGRRDKLVSWPALERLDAELSNSRLVRIPGAAHAPFLTNPRAVAETIDEFTALA